MVSKRWSIWLCYQVFTDTCWWCALVALSWPFSVLSFCPFRDENPHCCLCSCWAFLRWGGAGAEMIQQLSWAIKGLVLSSTHTGHVSIPCLPSSTGISSFSLRSCQFDSGKLLHNSWLTVFVITLKPQALFKQEGKLLRVENVARKLTAVEEKVWASV